MAKLTAWSGRQPAPASDALPGLPTALLVPSAISPCPEDSENRLARVAPKGVGAVRTRPMVASRIPTTLPACAALAVGRRIPKLEQRFRSCANDARRLGRPTLRFPATIVAPMA